MSHSKVIDEIFDEMMDEMFPNTSPLYGKFVDENGVYKNFIKFVNSYKQCNKNKGDKCEHSRCKYSILIIDSADFGQGSGFYCGRCKI